MRLAVTKMKGINILWKLYFYFMAALFAYFLIKDIMNPTLSGWVDMLLQTFTLIALYGFCFHRKILIKQIWQAVFVVCIFNEFRWIARDLISAPSKGAGNINAGIMLIIIVPLYIAVFLYAFKSEQLWANRDRQA